jgi:2,4-dienoyl-CoA reductase-like NADH-dependent reductase (Old Yellow Enzyme family)
VPSTFVVGVKINVADHMDGGGLEDMLEQIERIAEERIDYIELSGGSYESPKVCKSIIAIVIVELKLRSDAQHGELLD